MEPIWLDAENASQLADEWRAKAVLFRSEAGAEGAARALEAAARELVDWISEKSKQLYSLNEVARLVGRTPGTVSRAISQGRLKNYGRKGKPLIRAGDAAMCFSAGVARRASEHYDAAADARSILLVRRGA